MARHGRFRRRAALTLALALVCSASAPTLAQDDWSLSRPAQPAPAPNRSGPPSAARELTLALRALERRPVVEQLLASYRSREGGIDALLREVAARAAGREPRRWLLLLAQLQRVRGDAAAARAAFDRALALGPELTTLRLYAELEREQDEPARARELLQQAQSLELPQDRRLAIAEELLSLCASLGDKACAEAQFEALARDPNGFDRALAFPRALAEQHAYAEARAAYESLLARAQRSRCTVRVELGKLLLAQSALPEAREQLELARAQGCRDAALPALLEVQRGLGALPAFARELAASRDPEAQRLAGRAYEELGQPALAAEAYRRAFAQRPGDAALAERLIELAKRAGRTAEVIAIHERMLARPDPDSRWLRELCEWLRSQNQTEQALAIAARAGRAQPRSIALHRALVELYTAWELPDRAHAELEQLTRIDPDPASHVLALAEAELAEGREQQAVAVLRRLRNAAPTRLEGNLRLGEAYADHELPREALAEFESALRLDPDNLAAVRGRALALARVYRYRDAEAEWQRILHSFAAGPEQKRDAREQLVELWAELGELEKRVRDHEEAFRTSADVEAGRLLAECYLRLSRQPSYRAQPARYLRSAEDVLGQVVRLDPRDSASWRALERLRARRGDREGSIASLEQLASLEPERASEHLMRMAEYAQAAYRPQLAIEYGERAAQAAPQDAALHEWLGDAYRARRDDAGARQHYMRALELDATRLPVALRLAELHVSHGDVRAAQQLLLSVLRASNDPELVLRAGRAARELATTPAARAELERQLLSQQWTEPRAARRSVLIELYEALIPELLAEDSRALGATDATTNGRQRSAGAAEGSSALGASDAMSVGRQRSAGAAEGSSALGASDAMSVGGRRSGGAAEGSSALGASDAMSVGGRRSASAELSALRTRAEPALLDALADRDPSQVERAVRLLSLVGGPAAALPLLSLAESEAELSIRRSALSAVCVLGGSELAPRELALGLSREAGLRDIAAFCLARRAAPELAPALRKLAASDAPAVRVFAFLGLGALGATEQPGSSETLRIALAHDVSAPVRVAAALGLGSLGPAAGTTQDTRVARDLQLARDALAQALRGADAAIAEGAALALGLLADRAAAPALAFALFDVRPNVASAAELGLRALECSAPRQLVLAEPGPELSFDPLLTAGRNALAGCAQSPLAARYAEIAAAVRPALAEPSARRARALAWLASKLAEPDGAWQSELLSSIAADLAPLAADRDFRLRRDLALLLGVTPVTTAEATLFSLVGDSVLEVRAAALEALAQRKLPDRADYCERLARVATADEAFGMRRRAVLALAGMPGTSATRALVRVLANDPFALVRESAARALGGREPELVADALLAALRRDAEPRVRVAAARAVRQVGGALLHAARSDPQLPDGIREILASP